jgi:hypothetical protein
LEENINIKEIGLKYFQFSNTFYHFSFTGQKKDNKNNALEYFSYGFDKFYNIHIYFSSLTVGGMTSAIN